MNQIKRKLLQEYAAIRADRKYLTTLALAGALSLAGIFGIDNYLKSDKEKIQAEEQRIEKIAQERLEDRLESQKKEERVKDQWAKYGFEKQIAEFNQEMRAVYDIAFDEYMQDQSTTKASKAPTLDSEFQNKYKKLLKYKPIVEKQVAKYNKKFNFQQPLEPNYVMAMLMKEAGHGASLEKDPMQIANAGDHALRVFQRNEEYSWQIDNFPEIKGIKETKIKNYKRTYDPKLTPEMSIKVGIAYLIHKSAIRDNKGYIVGWRPWKKGIHRYNGNGVENYSNNVIVIKNKLARLEK